MWRRSLKDYFSLLWQQCDERLVQRGSRMLNKDVHVFGDESDGKIRYGRDSDIKWFNLLGIHLYCFMTRPNLYLQSHWSVTTKQIRNGTAHIV